ncbi:MAG: lysyl-tRNA synthetase, class [Blastocatellia bacterium]|jgi:lysyl-tRNA synthetase class 2|nr:lysyl-tRNA synthetase, class [Blastocatellia bacterium]
MTVPFLEDNDQTQARREHLEALRRLVGNVYPNKFERSNVTENTSGEDTITSVVDAFKKFEPQVAEGQKPGPDDLETANATLNKTRVRIAGRIAAPPRVMGKAAFVHLSDGTSRLQIYVRRQDIAGVRNDAEGGEVNGWDLFNLLDHGDFIGVDGYLFLTRTGELSVHVEKLQFLAKALLPMPDKMHGIQDAEIRQRQRYADLIAGSLKLEREEGNLTPREVFELRSKAVREIRRFLDDHGYIEVETPMLTPLATGAAAKPFKTHHNALDIDLYARIAPELYLKRLVVGGFEKVYELNRNFRNEGISTKHNPEFTMLEFYMAYADVNQMMDFAEKLLRSVVFVALGHTHVRYGKHEIDFSQPFTRMTMKEAIAKYWPNSVFGSAGLGEEAFAEEWLDDRLRVQALVQLIFDWNEFGILNLWEPGREDSPPEDERQSRVRAEVSQLWKSAMRAAEASIAEMGDSLEGVTAGNIATIFEAIAERHLIQPTFITDFPKAISPLSKASPSDPSIAERFEYFVGGLESGNGFSELNDPEEQYQRFNDQVQQRERGDEEAMVMDEDYIRALSYGMPPAAGIGLGIDRLVMLLANKQSIRDVIMFPHMRPERRADDEGNAGQ